jgi:hypothetical protein
MSIVLLVSVAVLVLSIGAKLHRGSFFRWSAKRDAPNTDADGRGGNDFR